MGKAGGHPPLRVRLALPRGGPKPSEGAPWNSPPQGTVTEQGQLVCTQPHTWKVGRPSHPPGCLCPPHPPPCWRCLPPPPPPGTHQVGGSRTAVNRARKPRCQPSRGEPGAGQEAGRQARPDVARETQASLPWGSSSRPETSVWPHLGRGGGAAGASRPPPGPRAGLGSAREGPWALATLLSEGGLVCGARLTSAGLGSAPWQ